MESTAFYLDICKNLSKQIFGDSSGSCHVLIGGEGTRKNEAISYIQEELRKEKINFYRGSNYFKAELAKYHIFNEILNDALGEMKNRSVEELMNGYNGLIESNNGKGTVLLIEGLESVSDESKDFFFYLSRMAQKKGLKLIGTFTTGKTVNDPYNSRFLRLLETEGFLNTIHVEKMRIEDLRFFLEKKGYNLPDRFVNDLFRLVNGNINTLKYTLKYYEEHGIINANKEVDDVVYRFFPIPQGLEIHYERVLSELTDEQNFVAELLALLQEETTYQKISRLAGLSDTMTLNILSKLEETGIVNEEGLKYDISNYRIRDFILGRLSNTRKLEIYSRMSESDLFPELPVQMQMNVLLQKGEIDAIGSSLIEMGSSVISKFVSLNSLIDFMTAFLEKSGDERYNYAAMLAKCEAVQQQGDKETSSSCYEDLISRYPDMIMPKVNLAKLDADWGNYDEALELIDGISADKDVKDSDVGMLYLAKGLIMMKKHKYPQAMEITERARSILSASGNKAEEAEALNTLGNICLETFKDREAMKYYEEALKINTEYKYLNHAGKNLNNIAIGKSYVGEYCESIEMFNQLIENSYLTGNLITRAFATYNLAETYYIVGRIDEVRSNIPSAVKLVELANRNNLRYRFFRFLSILHLNELDVDACYDSCEKALKAVDNDRDSQFYRIVYAMREFFSELLGNGKSDILPSLILEEMPEDEEFLPIFYSLGAIFFVLRGEMENALKVADTCIRRADSINERYGVLMSRLHKALVLFYKGDKDELAEFLAECPNGDTGVLKYDLLKKTLDLSCKTPGMSKEKFLKEIEKISEMQREAVDLVRLYKETIVIVTLKREFGVTADLSWIMEHIPNNFKQAFNTFAENISIL